MSVSFFQYKMIYGPYCERLLEFYVGRARWTHAIRVVLFREADTIFKLRDWLKGNTKSVRSLPREYYSHIDKIRSKCDSFALDSDTTEKVLEVAGLTV